MVDRLQAPSRYARGERRREELLDAVLSIVAQRGVAAVTHRAVAAAAGVSHRLPTYYFQTKEQMLLEAFRHLAARSLERTRAAAEGVAAAGDRAGAMRAAVDAVVDAVLGSLHAERGDVAAELTLVLEIAREPALARDYDAWQAEVRAILGQHARALGSGDPEGDARLITAVLHGLQIELLARPGRPRRAELRALVSRFLHAL